MSNPPPAVVEPYTSFPDWLRRHRQNTALSDVAARAGLDLTLLSRFEHGQRVPTAEQAEALARCFGVDAEEAHALRIADQFRRKYADHPAAGAAIRRLAEGAGLYGATTASAATKRKRKEA